MRAGRVVGTFVAVAMVVASALLHTPADGGPPPGSVDSQVLGQIEVRGWESASSAGRSTNAADPTPGLSVSQPTATATVVVAPTATASEVALQDSVDPSRVESELPADGIEFEALDLIAYDWERRLPGWRIVFLEGRADVRGLTYSQERRIEVFIRETDTVPSIARVVAHELGHAVDLTHGDESTRETWRAQRSIGEQTPWWPGSGAADFATGAGDFAECFATWQVGSATLSTVAGPCTDADLEIVEALS